MHHHLDKQHTKKLSIKQLFAVCPQYEEEQSHNVYQAVSAHLIRILSLHVKRLFVMFRHIFPRCMVAAELETASGLS